MRRSLHRPTDIQWVLPLALPTHICQARPTQTGLPATQICSPARAITQHLLVAGRPVCGCAGLDAPGLHAEGDLSGAGSSLRASLKLDEWLSAMGVGAQWGLLRHVEHGGGPTPMSPGGAISLEGVVIPGSG